MKNEARDEGVTPDYIGIKALNQNSIAEEYQAETTLWLGKAYQP